MFHYLFEDEEGEMFLVGADDEAEALRIADAYFDGALLIDVLSELEAEISGLDEY